MTVMMRCGHVANATYRRPDGVERPSCVICAGLTPGAYEVDEDWQAPPDRFAICAYARDATTPHIGKIGQGRLEPVPSSLALEGRLAFFESRPDEAYDRYFCGDCWGWD